MKSASDTARTAGFRRLLAVTLGATFVLVVVGGVVRLSDSGLGCGPAGSGFNGWPLCQGDLVPGLELNAVIEYSHRALASVVGLLMIATAVVALRRMRRSHPVVVRASLACVALVVAQGLLGAATVELNLDAALVAAHLGLAMILLGLLLYMRRAVPRPGSAGGDTAGSAGGGRGLRLLGAAASAAVLLTIVAGGYVAGTEKYGRTDQVAGAGAHYACGNDFPACNGGFMPFGQTSLADIQLTHRAFMYIASALVIALAISTLRRRRGTRKSPLAVGAVGLLTLQILLGALNVWIPEQTELLILAHLTVATMLWMSVAALTLELASAPAARPAGRATEADGGRSATNPVTA
ncbi:MAG: COX15/CtaA family protein [Actinomycetota bacterium]|nr:COX15/CtaA family protein [Actinomycetota bacterium]